MDTERKFRLLAAKEPGMASSASFRHFSTIAATVFGLTLLLSAGCQTQTSMVGELPSPNFNGPIAAPPPPAVAAVPQYMPPPSYKPPMPRAPIAGIPRDWIPPVAPRSWQAIVIHHSATPAGGAARFDREHREKGWDELGYDFVIGNGTDTGDGQVEVGSRWIKQKIGAHAKTPDNWYNEHAIGICLVGNFDQDRPTAAQMRSVAKLVAFMMKTYHIPADRIVGHGDTKPTDCPGRHMNVAEVRRMATQMLLAEGTMPTPDAQIASNKELLTDIQAR
jgi:hypothetical protein